MVLTIKGETKTIQLGDRISFQSSEWGKGKGRVIRTQREEHGIASVIVDPNIGGNMGKMCCKIYEAEILEVLEY